MSARYYFTPGGLERLRARIQATQAEYKAVCDDNPAALESGDSSGWHDNFAFEENQRQMHRLAARIRELQRVFDQSELTPPLTAVPPRVVIGANVTWQMDDDDARTCWIAGYDDGDPAKGRLSYNSPLGKAMLGAVPGDMRSVMLAGQERWIEILSIGPTPPEET